MVETPISMRDAVLEVLATDKFPCHNIHDLRWARREETTALAKAEKAIPSPDDPPEFALWLDRLRQPNITSTEREAVFDAMYDYFEPEDDGLVAR